MTRKVPHIKPALTPTECKAMRKQLGWTQLRLSQEAHVSYSSVKKFETGVSSGRLVTHHMKRAMERALGK